MRLFNVFVAGVAIWAPLAAGAADVPEMPQACRVSDQNGFVRILICEGPDLDRDVLIQAGQAGCGVDVPCGAWIWSDEADAPADAPNNHDGLTQSEVTSSMGVWVADSASFIAIEAVD